MARYLFPGCRAGCGLLHLAAETVPTSFSVFASPPLLRYLCAMKLWHKLTLLLVIVLFGSLYCFGQVKSRAYRAMLGKLLSHSVPECSVATAADEPAKAVFLDAREPEEYAVSHIQGALPVGYDHFDLASIQNLPKDTAIVVYCSVGYRSEKIAEKLIRAGFTRVSNLYGGIFEWVNEDHPVVNEQGPTDRVHAFDRKWGVWLNKGTKVY